MRHQHLLLEAAPSLRGSGGCDHLGGDSGQVAPFFVVFWVEHKWNQSRTAIHDAEPELFGESVTECCGAHLRDGQPACSYDDCFGLKYGLRCLNAEVPVSCD